jgi:hypothetical protein
MDFPRIRRYNMRAKNEFNDFTRAKQLLKEVWVGRRLTYQRTKELIDKSKKK